MEERLEDLDFADDLWQEKRDSLVVAVKTLIFQAV